MQQVQQVQSTQMMSAASSIPFDWQQQFLALRQRLGVLEEDLDLAHAETVVAQQNEAFLRSNVRSLQNDLNSYAALPAPPPSQLGDSSSEEVILL